MFSVGLIFVCVFWPFLRADIGNNNVTAVFTASGFLLMLVSVAIKLWTLMP